VRSTTRCSKCNQPYDLFRCQKCGRVAPGGLAGLPVYRKVVETNSHAVTVRFSGGKEVRDDKMSKM